MLRKTIFGTLILCLMLCTVSCNTTEPTPPTETDTDAVETTAPIEVPQVKNYTYSGLEIPNAVTDVQYLDTVPADEGKEGKIVYTVNDTNAGTIIGATVQNAGDKTFTVRAEANLGYKFIRWSDGLEDPVRSGDTEEGVYTAIFDYEVLDLPIVVINTDGSRQIRSKTRYIDATISILGCEEEFVLDSVTTEIRGRGNATWRFDKKSYKFKLTEKENIFDMANGKERIWVLLANHCDQTLLRNHVAMEIGRSLSGIAWEPASMSVDVYLNGEYMGVYLLAEEIKVSGDRVNVTDTEPDEIDTGYLLEMSSYARDDWDNVIITVAKRDVIIHNELSTDPEIYNAQKKFIEDYANECYQALKNGDYEECDALIDLDSLVAAYILQETIKNQDSHWDNFYMWKDKGGKLNFGPFWDFDIAIGNAWEEASTYEGIFAGNGEGASDSLANWFPIALMNDWFRQMVVDEWNKMYEKTSTLPEYVIEEAQRAKGSYERNYVKWETFGTRQNLEPDEIMALRTYTEHYTYLAEWLENRIEWLNEAFNDEAFVTEGKGLIRVRR